MNGLIVVSDASGVRHIRSVTKENWQERRAEIVTTVNVVEVIWLDENGDYSDARCKEDLNEHTQAR